MRKLARETPAALIVFDLLVDEKGRLLAGDPLSERRARLEAFARRTSPTTPRSGSRRPRLSRGREEVALRVGLKLDGVVAKRLDLPYRSGDRTGMQKVKLMRTADCVVGGFRYGTGKTVGSLLLGLYDAEGLLDHIGFCSSLTAAQKSELTPQLETLIEPPGFTGRAPGGPSRWSTERSAEWEPSNPGSSSRSATITSPRAASATARSSSAGGPTSRRTSARWTRSRVSLPPLPSEAGEREGSPLASLQRRPWPKATFGEAAAGRGEGAARAENSSRPPRISLPRNRSPHATDALDWHLPPWRWAFSWPARPAPTRPPQPRRLSRPRPRPRSAAPAPAAADSIRETWIRVRLPAATSTRTPTADG